MAGNVEVKSYRRNDQTALSSQAGAADLSVGAFVKTAALTVNQFKTSALGR